MEHPENSGAYVIICEPDHDKIMRELITTRIPDDGSVELLKGEIGTVNSDFRFVPSVMPLGGSREKAQWKRERKGRP